MMYPHERSLVQRLEGKPFALIGINSDEDRNAVKQVIRKERITWRSFWNGGSTNGPISRAWRVRGWPSMWLIDAKGVIRQTFVGLQSEEPLNREIDALLREMSAN